MSLSAAEAKALLREIILNPIKRASYEIGGPSWLGHRGGAGQIDEMLIEGASFAELSTARGAVKEHFHHLRKEWGLLIKEISADIFYFDRSQLDLPQKIFPVKISAKVMMAILKSLAFPCVITKNTKPEWEVNYRPRAMHTTMLDGYWTGQPGKVKPGNGFALHFVKHKGNIWLGDYLGTVPESKEGRFSLIIGDAQLFHVADIEDADESQKQLKAILNKNGAVTYSYFNEQEKLTRDEKTPEGPAYKMGQVKQRLHQHIFRDEVFNLHGRKCKVTGCEVEVLLEAAHLRGRNWAAGHNTAGDGIPLRADVHRAYDKELIDLNEDFRISAIHDEKLKEHYKEYFVG